MTDHTHTVSAAHLAAKDITFGSVRIHGSRCRQIVTCRQISGIASKIFEHPFDLTKVRLQSQVLDATARFNGPIDCLVRTFRNEGVRGLYRVRHCLVFLRAWSHGCCKGVACTSHGRHGRKRNALRVV